MSREIVMNSDEAIERMVNVLRTRMQEALREHRPVRCHAKAGMLSFTEEDGSFAFTMLIDKRPATPSLTPLDKRCGYDGCSKEWQHERKVQHNVYRLCEEHHALVFPPPVLLPPQSPVGEAKKPYVEGDPTVCSKCQRVFFNGSKCPWCGEPR